ncbi:MAG: hypothetical protein ACYC3S_15510 [Chloroflexota bacterium]
MNDSYNPRQKHNDKDTITFAHHSEREFVRILDFYQIEWQYEPRTFQLQWDEHGNPIESFAPDFYLPELDLFIELTTLRQSLVTKKNRKLRRLRELYPDINIKLFYNRDFKNLMSKYGIALAKPETTPRVSADAAVPDTGHKKSPSSFVEEGDKLSPE